MTALRAWAQAVCPEERAVAVETGAQRVAATLRWLHRRRFMSPQQLQRFASTVGNLSGSGFWRCGSGVKVHALLSGGQPVGLCFG